VVFREASLVGTAVMDVPNFAAAGDTLNLLLTSVFVVENGRLVEWSDYG
jgi:limonene-1,2-epoxide hydrolase